MKIIFLDIDGVLNCTDAPMNNDCFVDDDKIMLLKRIVDETGANIVLTSSWRDGWYDQDLGEHTVIRELYETLVRKLAEYDLELMDKTSRLGTYRRDEIESWMTECGEKIEAYVILDDLEAWHFEGMTDRFVKADRRVGLTEQLATMAINVLNGGRMDEDE